MLDLETLGTSHDALIVQIGVCFFDPETGEIGSTFETTVMPLSDYAGKFSINHETVMWWLSQSPEAQVAIRYPDVALHEALLHLKTFLHAQSSEGPDEIWCHASFDAPILKHAYSALGIKFPVHYKNFRDIRTLLALSGYDKDHSPTVGVSHTALDDCRTQVGYCVAAMKKLKNQYV